MKVCADLSCAAVGCATVPAYHWITPSAVRHGQDAPPAGCLAACPPSGSMIADAGVLARAAAFTAPSNAVIVAASIGPSSTSDPARNPDRELVVPPPTYLTASRCAFTVIDRTV